MLEIRGPDLDALLEARSAADGEAPYWAELWPSGRALAMWILSGGAGSLSGLSVLDLGSGLGLGAIAAALAGAARAVASDVDPEALPYAEANAVHAGVGERVAVTQLDWGAREQPTGFDVVLGADVLYDQTLAPTLLRAVARTLAPRGTAWLADPGRRTADEALRQAGAAGLSATLASRFSVGDGERIRLLPCEAGGEPLPPTTRGRIFRVRHR